MGNLEKYKCPIFQYWRGYSNILPIFSDCINIFQRTLVLSSSAGQVLSVGLLELCPFRWENLEPWNYSRMNFPFPNIVAVILIFWYFFSDSMDIFQRLNFKFQRPNFGCLIGIEVCHSVLGVFRSMNRVYRMKVSFLIISGVVLILWKLFQILLISFKVY